MRKRTFLSSGVSPGCAGTPRHRPCSARRPRRTTGRSARNRAAPIGIFSRWMYLPDVKLGQLEMGNTRIDSPFVLGVVRPEFRPLALRSQRWLRGGKEQMRSLARLFSSSRRGAAEAASKPNLSSACFRPSVFQIWCARRNRDERVDVPFDSVRDFCEREARSSVVLAIRSRISTWRGTSRRVDMHREHGGG